MPEGCHHKRKKGQARKPVQSELAIAREQVAKYSGLVSRISSFYRLKGETDAERFDSVVKFFDNKEEERRNIPPAF